MMRAFRAILLAGFSLTISLSPLLLKNAQAAQNSAKLYLSPSSGAVAKGSTLAVGVYVDSAGDRVTSAQTTLSYTASLLSYVAIDNSNAFPVDTGSSGGNGTVNISRANNAPVSGPQLIATVRFTALADNGTATITFGQNAQIIRASDNQPEKVTSLGGSYIMTPASSDTSNNSAPTTTTGAVDLTHAAITDIKVTNLGTNTATIEWSTNVPASSEVDYGFSTNYIWQAIDNTLVKDHKVALDSKNLSPGQTYHFMVKSYDQGLNASSSDDQALTTTTPPPIKKSNTGSIIVLVVLVIVIVGGLGAGGYYAHSQGLLNFGGNKKPPGTTPPAAGPQSSPPSPPASSTPA